MKTKFFFITAIIAVLLFATDLPGQITPQYEGVFAPEVSDHYAASEITILPNGNYVTAGWYDGILPSVSSMPELTMQAIVMSADQDGSLLWSYVFDCNSMCNITSLTSSDNHIYVSGWSADLGYFGATNYQILGNTEFVASFDHQGNPEWITFFRGGNGNSTPQMHWINSVQLGPDGNIYAQVYFRDYLNVREPNQTSFTNVSGTNTDEHNIGILKLNQNGAVTGFNYISGNSIQSETFGFGFTENEIVFLGQPGDDIIADGVEYSHVWQEEHDFFLCKINLEDMSFFQGTVIGCEFYPHFCGPTLPQNTPPARSFAISDSSIFLSNKFTENLTVGTQGYTVEEELGMCDSDNTAIIELGLDFNVVSIHALYSNSISSTPPPKMGVDATGLYLCGSFFKGLVFDGDTLATAPEQLNNSVFKSFFAMKINLDTFEFEWIKAGDVENGGAAQDIIPYESGAYVSFSISSGVLLSNGFSTFDRTSVLAKLTTDYCSDDANGDSLINTADLVELLTDLGSPCTITPCVGDINNDGVINTVELISFLSNFGQVCD